MFTGDVVVVVVDGLVVDVVVVVVDGLVVDEEVVVTVGAKHRLNVQCANK